MDRNIVYPGSIPLDTDLLYLNRNVMTAIGFLAQAVLGTGQIVDGLTCSPTTPASMQVVVAPGSITQLSVLDTSSYGSLAADTTTPLLKMGIKSTASTFTLSAPSGAGQATNYLIQVAFSEADAAPVVIPYYNAANPALAFAGPNNNGSAQSTMRLQTVLIAAKAGTPAPAGTQTTPVPDSGWVGLYQITVSQGQSSIGPANIQKLTTAPFVPWKLPALSPGFGGGVRSFTSSGTFVVPAGVGQVEVELWGGGSGSFASTSTAASGGGSGGGYARRRITGLLPGQSIAFTVGAGGTAGTVAGQKPPTAGQSTSFGSNGTDPFFFQATGGSLNPSATPSNPQNGATPPGNGVGGDVNLYGSAGQIAFQSVGGMGGGSPMGGMQTSGTSGNSGLFPGGGASGAGTGASASTPYDGGAGASGLVIVRW